MVIEGSSDMEFVEYLLHVFAAAFAIILNFQCQIDLFSPVHAIARECFYIGASDCVANTDVHAVVT
jgi:hypothetical protein